MKVHLRGDCGFGVPRMYEVCDELGLTYTFGLGQNPCVKRLGEAILAEAVTHYENGRTAATVRQSGVSGRVVAHTATL